MKKFVHNFLLLCVSLFLIFAVSCEEDEGSEGPDSGNLVGKWNFAELQFEATVDGTDIIDWYIAELEITESEAEQFKSFFEEEFSEGLSGSMTFNADNTYSVTDEEGTETGKWELKGDLLTMTPDGEGETPATLTVVSLTSDKLVLGIEESEKQDLDIDGTSETLAVKVQMTLTK